MITYATTHPVVEAIKVSQIAQLKATQKRIREEFRMLVTAIRDKYFQTVECYRKIVSIKVKEDNDRALVLKRRAAKHSKALPALTAAGEEDVDVEGWRALLSFRSITNIVNIIIF